MYFTQTPPLRGLKSGLLDSLPLPTIENHDSLPEIVNELATYITGVVEAPYTFEQLRAASARQLLKPLIRHLSDNCHHSEIVPALLILKWDFSSLQQDDHGVNESRALACELVAWRYLTHRSEDELIDYLLHEIPPEACDASRQGFIGQNHGDDAESAPLLPRHSASSEQDRYTRDETNGSPCHAFIGLNALEIAAISNAKKFLSQRVVQKVVNDIWDGNIVFWESLSVHSKKRAHVYNKSRSDPYCRLRVPKYQKAFEAVFFVVFLTLYYVVLAERNPTLITTAEIFLFIWIAAFAYEELGEFQDAGTLFYAADFWSLWDIAIIGIGVAFFVSRIVGLSKQSANIVDISFDILSIEALFLVPRVCSLLTLNSYFGTLIPCLKEMTKDFVKFLSIVIILFIAFLTTFTMLARGSYTAREVLWLMINVFFGSSYLGFDIASKISAGIGPPLMVVFVILTNILLLTSLIAILGQSLSKVMDHAREEYAHQYSVFVLEATASRRLTYYFPPLNLIPLLLFRPLRICIPSAQMRSARIILLKITHAPCIASIWIYETLVRHVGGRRINWPYLSPMQQGILSSNNVKRRPEAIQVLGVRNRSETSLPKTPRTPISASGRLSNGGATHADGNLNVLRGALDGMERNIEQVAKQLESSTGLLKRELNAQIRSSNLQFEKLRLMAANNETKLDQLLAKLEMIAGQD